MTLARRTNWRVGGAGWQEAIRCLFVAILSLSLVFQGQLSSGHMHWPDSNGLQTSGDQPDSGKNAPDKRQDTKCFLCQQLASAHNYLFSTTTFAFGLTEHGQRIVFAALVVSEPSSSSFSWSSRAPPIV